MTTVTSKLVVHCTKHGTHPHTISSDIEGHEGVWCLLCCLELLGPPSPSEYINDVPLNMTEATLDVKVTKHEE